MYPINTHIDAGYLLKSMLSKTSLGMAARNDTRVAMPKINREELNAILVAVPPLAERRQIVEKVDHLLELGDELAARQAAQREKQQRLVAATLDRLVSPGIASNIPAPRLPGWLNGVCTTRREHNWCKSQ